MEIQPMIGFAGGQRLRYAQPMSFICKLFGHRRSKSRARRRGGIWVSECIFCGAPMTRIGPNDWAVD